MNQMIRVPEPLAALRVAVDERLVVGWNQGTLDLDHAYTKVTPKSMRSYGNTQRTCLYAAPLTTKPHDYSRRQQKNCYSQH